MALSVTFFFQSTYAQQDTNKIAIPDDSLEVVFDTLNIKKIQIDTLKKQETEKPFKMKKSPWLAVGLSAIFPGIGQVCNRSYWKLPIIGLVAGYLGYEIFYNNSKFLNYRDLYANSQTQQNPNGDIRYKNLRESYRDNRDQFILYFGLFYLINIADAYVDAHLFDFDVSDKIKLGMKFYGTGARLNLNF